MVDVISGARLVCRVCGRQLSEGDAVPVYEKVLDRERGESKLILLTIMFASLVMLEEEGEKCLKV